MSHLDLLNRHLANIGQPIAEQDLTIYSPSIVVEFPYAPEDHTRRIEGSEGYAKFLAAIGNFAEAFTLSEPSYSETKEGFVAEFHGKSVFKSTGRPYAQDYVLIAAVQDGQVTHFREFYDPMRVLRAMGEID